jgi:hypothetical protein
VTKDQLLKKLDRAWTDLRASYAGLSAEQMAQPGVMGDWSVKDILAHVRSWEEEALKYLPLILEGKQPPRYADLYGGIDAFNARMAEKAHDRSLSEIQEQLDQTHARLVEYINTTPEELFTRETRFRRRLRLDTYSHYPIHARAIQEWRERSA